MRYGCFEIPDHTDWEAQNKDITGDVDNPSCHVEGDLVDTSTVFRIAPEVAYWMALEYEGDEECGAGRENYCPDHHHRATKFAYGKDPEVE